MPAIPTAASMLAGVATTSSPMFQELLPWGLMGAGFLIGGVVVYAVISWIVGGVESAAGLHSMGIFSDTHPDNTRHAHKWGQAGDL